MQNTYKVLKSIRRLSNRSGEKFVSEKSILSAVRGIDADTLIHLEKMGYLVCTFLPADEQNALPKAYSLTPSAIDCIADAQVERKRDLISMLSLLFAIIAALPVIAAFAEWLLQQLCP